MLTIRGDVMTNGVARKSARSFLPERERATGRVWEQPCETLQQRSRITMKPPAQRAGISLSERIPAAAGIVNLRYKSCPEMAGQDQLESSPIGIRIYLTAIVYCPTPHVAKQQHLQQHHVRI